VLIGDEVAVKVLHAKFVNDQTLVERFRREARAAAQLNHPNVVTIHDYGEARGPEGFAYIVMELVRGESLRDLLRREGKLQVGRAVALMRGVCAGVGAAHRRGIVHRDIKPDNIIVVPPDEDDPTERVKVVDFGIAKLRDMAAEGALTHVGAVVGTPHYMSPEQCKGEPLDARADVYSLGALLYEMLAGSPPFTAGNISGVILKHVNEPPPPVPQDLRVPAALQESIARALSKDPEGRQRDATELARDLQAALSPATAKLEQQPTLQIFPATTQPAPVVPTSLTMPPLTPTPNTNASSAQPSPAGAGDTAHTSAANRAAPVHPQPSPPQPYAQGPQQNFNAPRRKSRVPLVVGLLVLLLAGLGVLGLAGLIYLGSQSDHGTVASVNARPTPAQTSVNRNAANSNAGAANVNAGEVNASATPTLAVTDAMQRAEQKIVAGNLLESGDLAGLSAAQLRILRNAVFARYGRVFQSPDLQTYFQGRPWYHPRTDSSEKMLTANDRANADLLKSFEDGGATASAPVASDPATARKEVASVLEGWADSLRERDIGAHMSYYADTLDTYYAKQNASASQVRADRSRAFEHYDTMDVTLSDIQITPDPTGTRAVATFNKAWAFDSGSRRATGSVRQQLTLTNFGGRWLITGEKDLQVFFTNNEDN
jgi:serine/threonine-protein kinase